MKRTIALATASILLTGTLAAGAAGAGLKVGEMAPDFELPGSDGKTYKLSDFKGKKAVAEGLGDGEEVSLGRHTVRWLYTPHLPHAWECGYLFEVSTRTLLCGDLFTQGGHEHVPTTESDILGPSEAMRAQMDYFAHSPDTGTLIEKLARTEATTLGCMHGSSFRGDAPSLLRSLGRALVQGA